MTSNGPTWGNWYWPLCLIVTAVMILGPEIFALFTNSYNTLSWWVWRQLEVSPLATVPWTAAHLIVLGLWLTAEVWLTGHFFWMKWR